MTEQNNRLREVFSGQSKYCYDGTNVLKNKLNLQDEKSLEKAERSLTLLRLTQLQMYGLDIPFSFRVEYYLKIHYFIFQDLYYFAGVTRNENITKGNTPFCRPEFIYKYLDYLLKEMFLKTNKITTKEELVDYLAYYYSEINVVHPFRDEDEPLEQKATYLQKCLQNKGFTENSKSFFLQKFNEIYINC